jgi:hypothetical protein
MNYDNHAYRLLELLNRGKEFRSDQNCRKCWEQLLNAPGDSALLMARLGRVMALPHAIVQDVVASFPSQGDTWRHWEGQISAAFMVQNLHGEWKSFFSNVDDHSFNYLRLAADLLNTKSSARLLEGDEVARVRQSLDDVLRDVLASDIALDLKAQVARCLRRILVSLDEYRLTGGVVVLEAAEVALGHASVDSEYRSFLLDSELGRRALDTIAAAANLLTISLGVPTLSVALAPLLK